MPPSRPSSAHPARQVHGHRREQAARGVAPPVGRCALCRFRRALSTDTSRRDGLKRLVCTPCYSRASLVEGAGHSVNWDAARHAGDAVDPAQQFQNGEA